MTDFRTAQRRILDAGIEKLRSTLETRGFEYLAGEQGSASGGPFAVGLFRHGWLEIGLIVRDDQLGCPNYTDGNGYAGHDHLVAALGANGREQLVPGPWLSYCSRKGGDAFDALQHDLENIVVPAYVESPVKFREALLRARNMGWAKIGLKPRDSG